MATITAREPRFGFQEHQVFWNERGAIVCACCHIPYPGSDTWVWERWEEITPEIMVEIDREGGRAGVRRLRQGAQPDRARGRRHLPSLRPRGHHAIERPAVGGEVELAPRVLAEAGQVV